MLALPNYLYRHTALTIYVENRDFTVAEDLLHFREYLLCEICFEVMQFHIKNKEPITNPIAIMKHHAKSVNVSFFMIILHFTPKTYPLLYNISSSIQLGDKKLVPSMSWEVIEFFIENCL